MKIKIIVCALLLVPALAFGQAGTAGLGSNRPRSSYDPGAAGLAKSQQQSGVATALQKINPQDKDYGVVIEQGRIAAFEETLDNFYWRSCMVLTVLLMIATMYIVWLWRERELRLRISGDIVAQLYNSHVAARAKAIETIEKHNQLVRRYNAQSVEIARVKAEAEGNEEKASRKEESKIVHTVQSDQENGVESAGSPGKAESSLSSRPGISSPGIVSDGDGNSGDLASLVKTLQAQITAKDQKIANLRTQVNRAHSSLTEEREGKNARPS
jgi:hypothetical protein